MFYLHTDMLDSETAFVPYYLGEATFGLIHDDGHLKEISQAQNWV